MFFYGLEDKLGFIGELVYFGTLNTEPPKTHDVRFGEPLAARLPLLKKRSKTTDGFEQMFRKFSKFLTELSV